MKMDIIERKHINCLQSNVLT